MYITIHCNDKMWVGTPSGTHRLNYDYLVALLSKYR